MSAISSESGSDTTLETQERHVSPVSGSKRKSVIDTRRAEQNRAAQRAFRQRKEVYVKELENKVRDMEILKDRLETLEMENERLKYRVWELESSPTTPTLSNKNHTYNDTCASGDTQPRWQLHPIDTTPKIKTTVPSSSPSLSPPQSSGSHHILPPPSPSPSVFRPIPVAYWESNKRHRSGDQERTPAEHGQVLDDLASILRTHHRPPIHQNEHQQRQDQPEPELMHT